MFSRAPFAGFVILYMAGIAAGRFLSAGISPVWLGIATLLAAFASFILYRKKWHPGPGIAVSLFFFISGFASHELTAHRLALVEQNLSPDHEQYLAEITSLPERREYAFRFEAKLKRVFQNVGWQDQDSKILLNVPLESHADLRPGSMILVKGTLKPPAEAANPFQFDYSAYLRNKGILWTGQLRTNAFTVLHSPAGSPGIHAFAQQISANADSIFKSSIGDPASYGLVKAMVLGRRDDLDPEQVDHYIASGTVHILSVSGMHVAILFLLVATALGWIKKFRGGRWLYLFTVLSLLGFYAIVTGLSPSVQRSALMCGIFVLAEVFGRKNNSMNTLAISALLILLVDPFALFDVGFQLSYLAMSGIFWFYEPIRRLFNPGNRVTKFVWEISAMSFAAQLATFPLSIYYFHQFPTYFWLANPFVIAFTNVLLPAAMALLAVHYLSIAWLENLAAFVVDWSAKLANWSVQIPERLPGFLLENLHLSVAELFLLYIIMLTAWLAFEYRSFTLLKLTALSIFLFCFISISISIQTYYKTKMVAFHMRGHKVIGFKQGSTLNIAADRSFQTDQKAFNFYVKPYVAHMEISRIVFVEKSR